MMGCFHEGLGRLKRGYLGYEGACDNPTSKEWGVGDEGGESQNTRENGILKSLAP